MRLKGGERVRSARGWAVVAVLVLGATTACSTEIPGQAISGAATLDDGDPAPSSASGPPEPTDGQIAALDPCDLFTSAAKSTLGVTGSPEPDETRSAKVCQWKVAKQSVADGYTYAVAIFPRLGIDKVVADGEKKELTIGPRRAVESLRGGGAACAISIEITPTSRVDIQANGGPTGPALCPMVLDAAKLLEPELP